jgi:group I intron endonuclease
MIMDAKAGVYKITCKPMGKAYFGSTVRGVKLRWWEHKRALQNNNHHSILLQRAWNKYGRSAFTWTLIRNFDNRHISRKAKKNLVLACEQKFLDKFFASRKTLNVHPNAHSPLGVKRSKRTRALLSTLRKGTRASDATRLKMSLARAGSKNGMFGRKHSLASRRKISQAAKRRDPTRLGAVLSSKTRARIAASLSGLSVRDIRCIRRLYSTGKHSLVKLGIRFDVTKNTIHKIVRRQTWAHV